MDVLFCLAFPLSKMKRMQTELEKHRHRDSKESKQKHRQAVVWDRCERGSEHINKTNRLHALAIRAAAVAAAVPEQSPPASRLWGATPESPYWSLEWAETHFLWAQVTWRKEQKRVEARGHRVMRRRKTKKRWGVGEAMCWEGVRVEEVEGQRGEEWSKTKRKENKKIIEDLSQAEAGLLRQSMLIEE